MYKPANTRLLDVIPEYTRSGRVHRPRDNPSAYLRREVSSSVPTRCTGVRAQRSLDGRCAILVRVSVDEGLLYRCLNTLTRGGGYLSCFILSRFYIVFINFEKCIQFRNRIN